MSFACCITTLQFIATRSLARPRVNYQPFRCHSDRFHCHRWIRAPTTTTTTLAVAEREMTFKKFLKPFHDQARSPRRRSFAFGARFSSLVSRFALLCGPRIVSALRIGAGRVGASERVESDWKWIRRNLLSNAANESNAFLICDPSSSRLAKGAASCCLRR